MKALRCCFSSNKRVKKDVVLLLVGLDNSGKTTALRSLTGKDMRVNVLPTVGFASAHLKHKGCNSVTFYDLGGGESIRDIWPSYFNDIHGVIFAVDCSDRNKLPVAKEALHSLLSTNAIRMKPLLVLGTKQDIPDAMDDGELTEGLDLEELVNRLKTPARLELTSVTGPGIDQGLREGYRWLVGQVLVRWEELNGRVLRDREKAHQPLVIPSPITTSLPEIEQVGNGKHIALVHSADSGVVASPIRPSPSGYLRERRSKSAGERRWKSNKIMPAGAFDQRISTIRLPSVSSLHAMVRHPTQSREELVSSERW